MNCKACGKESDKLYAGSHPGPFYCASCFGMSAPVYVGGETWLQKGWREWAAGLR